MTADRRETTPEAAARELAGYHVVDVREASEFDGPLGHISDAQWIALSELEQRADALPSDLPLLMVCRSGNRSGMACDRLAERGRHDAVNLQGGMIAWNERGLPVDRRPFASAEAILEAFAVWLAQVTRVPSEDAMARVREARAAESDADASEALVVTRTIDRLERSLRSAENVPADLGLVCEALRGDAARLVPDPDEESSRT